MTNSNSDFGSFLVIDVGSVTTRAILFDIVDDRYRYLASGESPTTLSEPFFNIKKGIENALENLQDICGRNLVGLDGQLIIPSQKDGSGVDTFTAVISAGAPLNIVAIGLHEEISMQSALSLAETVSTKVCGLISLNDRKDPEARINMIIDARPDLVIAAGGLEKGANEAVNGLLEAVGLACKLMPKNERPEILFVGNQEIWKGLHAGLHEVATIHNAPNIRPELDVEMIEPAQDLLAEIAIRTKGKRIPGVAELNSWAERGLLPASTAFGQVIKFLSESHPSQKGVLGVDLGASSITISAAFGGKLTHGVYPQFGLSSDLSEMLGRVEFQDISRWLIYDIPDRQVHEYLVRKAIYPGAIPVTLEELDLEGAIARQAMRNALQMVSRRWPKSAHFSREDLLPWVEPILASGSIFSKSTGAAQSALLLLDGLQPTGVTTLVVDQNQITPAIGAAAGITPTLAAQLMDTSSFTHLATVITPVGTAQPGTPVLRLKITSDGGRENGYEVRQGALEVLPLPSGKGAQIQLQPLQKFDVGMGAPGLGGSLRASGGLLGLIIDARGRPLAYPQEKSRRRELVKKWLWTIGGH